MGTELIVIIVMISLVILLAIEIPIPRDIFFYSYGNPNVYSHGNVCNAS
jgi:hypothetical protein